MIDLTPLDVRKKRGDFRKVLRGYDPEEVDAFLEVAAERLEEIVKLNLTLEERVERLQEQVSHQEGREEAVREALVTAQELRRDTGRQAKREAALLRREAEARIETTLAGAERRLEERQEALEEVERMRLRFLKSFRTLLERQLDAVEVEEGRAPLEDTALEIDFTVGDLRSVLHDTSEEAIAPPSRAEAPTGEAGHRAPVREEEAGSGGGKGSARRTESSSQRAPAPRAPDAESEPKTSDERMARREMEERDGDVSRGGGEDDSLWLSSILKEEDGDGTEGEGPRP